jgi:hypothetical protein
MHTERIQGEFFWNKGVYIGLNRKFAAFFEVGCFLL